MFKKRAKIAISIILGLFLTACGTSGSDDGSAGSSKSVSKGQITLKSPGTITVNQSQYSTNSGA